MYSSKLLFDDERMLSFPFEKPNDMTVFFVLNSRVAPAVKRVREHLEVGVEDILVTLT